MCWRFLPRQPRQGHLEQEPRSSLRAVIAAPKTLTIQNVAQLAADDAHKPGAQPDRDLQTAAARYGRTAARYTPAPATVAGEDDWDLDASPW